MSKRLYRSNNDRVIAGVCGGLAEYFNVDSTLIRLAFVFFLGFNLVFYIIALLVIPERNANEFEDTKDDERYHPPVANRYDYDRNSSSQNYNQDRDYNYYDTGEKENNPSEKKLYRSQNNRVIAGVCGGIAEYFNVDASVVRIIIALLAFAYGGGIIAYFIAWLVIPERVH